MKTIIAVLFIYSLSFAQENDYKEVSHNPDGNSPSLHITPYLSWGRVNNNILKPKTTNYGEVVYAEKLDFNVTFKVPLTRTFTLSFIYEYRNQNYEYMPIENDYVNSVRESGTGSLNIIGATFSFYFDWLKLN